VAEKLLMVGSQQPAGRCFWRRPGGILGRHG
jgi:hypothetical protein